MKFILLMIGISYLLLLSDVVLADSEYRTDRDRSRLGHSVGIRVLSDSGPGADNIGGEP